MKLRFWSSIIAAALILLMSTFILGMSALGVDLFSPQDQRDLPGVNKLVYYFNTNDDQEEKQREFIISREVGNSVYDTAKKQKQQDKTILPSSSNPADAFEAETKGPAAKVANTQNAPPVDNKISFTFNVKMTANYTAQVFDEKNALVKTFYKNTPLDLGEKTIVWDKTNDTGQKVVTGKYFFKLTTMSPGVPVLIYHHLALGGKGYDENPYTETPENFLAQMDYLLNNKYNVISLDQLIDFMNGNQMLPPKTVVITFDDGYESVYKYAFPILKKHNFKATAFIIGKKAEGKKPNFVPSLNFNELKEMYESGTFDIQSHTYDLHDKVQISPYGEFGYAITVKMYLKDKKRMETDEEFLERITNDLKKSKDILEQNVGTKVVSLSWPHGRDLEKVTKIAEGLGFKYFIEGNLGPNYIGDSVTNIKRVFVKKGIADQDFAKILNPASKKVVLSTATAEVK